MAGRQQGCLPGEDDVQAGSQGSLGVSRKAHILRKNSKQRALRVSRAGSGWNVQSAVGDGE